MTRIMRIKGNTSITTSLLITFSILSLILIPGSARMIVNIILDKAVFAYGQSSQMNSNSMNPLNLQDIPAKKVHVGDIDIAYKIFGKGNPFLLISGLWGDMNSWPPSTLRSLSLNHTVIIFDNGGIGNTTSGTKPFSIQQFANDTTGLLDSLKIQKADVAVPSANSLIITGKIPGTWLV